MGKTESVDDPDEHSALREAKDFLAGLLANGPLPAKQIKREADEAGHAEKLFAERKRWIEEGMRTVPTPFVRIAAVLIPLDSTTQGA